jgi:hypothetical protein
MSARGAQRTALPGKNWCERLSDGRLNFQLSVPVWRARRLRTHLTSQIEAGGAAREAGNPRRRPDELKHRAEARCWLFGWDRAFSSRNSPPGPSPSARQLARLKRWQTGAGGLRHADGDLRRTILEAVADELLSARPLALGAIAAAHRETVRRCREAGLPAPRASRYRRWLKLSRGV